MSRPTSPSAPAPAQVERLVDQWCDPHSLWSAVTLVESRNGQPKRVLALTSIDEVIGRVAAPDVDSLTLLTSGSTERWGLAMHVARSGEVWVGLIQRRASDAAIIGSDAVQSLAVDALHRVLGMATEPPQRTTAWYWLSVWIADLMAEAPWLWPVEAAAMHPAIQFDEVIGLDGDGLVEFCAERHREFARHCGWTEIRSHPPVGFDPMFDLANLMPGWHDDGSFSRFVVDAVPDLCPLVLGPELDSPLSHLMAPTQRLVGSVALLCSPE